MSALRVGLYYQLPYGGAARLMNTIEDALAPQFELVRLTPLTPPPNRLHRDFINFVSIYDYSRRLAAQITAHQLDVLLVSHDAYFAAPAILALCPIPTVFYCHEPTRALWEHEFRLPQSYPWYSHLYESGYRLLKRLLEVRNARHAGLILTNSEYTKDYIARAYGVAATVVPPAISRVFVRSEQERQNYVMLVGNHEPQKRLELAIRAIAKLSSAHRPTLHLVCPRSAPGSSLLHLARRHGVKLRVSVGISDSELVQLYQGARATLSTALREPFGLSLAESIRCGTPVVAVNEGGVGGIVIEGQTGYLATATASSLAQAINQVLKNPALRCGLSPEAIAASTSTLTVRRLAAQVATALVQAASS